MAFNQVNVGVGETAASNAMPGQALGRGFERGGEALNEGIKTYIETQKKNKELEDAVRLLHAYQSGHAEDILGQVTNGRNADLAIGLYKTTLAKHQTDLENSLTQLKMNRENAETDFVTKHGWDLLPTLLPPVQLTPDKTEEYQAGVEHDTGKPIMAKRVIPGQTYDLASRIIEARNQMGGAPIPDMAAFNSLLGFFKGQQDTAIAHAQYKDQVAHMDPMDRMLFADKLERGRADYERQLLNREKIDAAVQYKATLLDHYQGDSKKQARLARLNPQTDFLVLAKEFEDMQRDENADAASARIEDRTKKALAAKLQAKQEAQIAAAKELQPLLVGTVYEGLDPTKAAGVIVSKGPAAIMEKAKTGEVKWAQVFNALHVALEAKEKMAKADAGYSVLEEPSAAKDDDGRYIDPNYPAYLLARQKHGVDQAEADFNEAVNLAKQRLPGAQMGATTAPAARPVTAPATQSEAAKEAAAAKEFNDLPKDQQTPEKFQEINARHGVK